MRVRVGSRVEGFAIECASTCASAIECVSAPPNANPNPHTHTYSLTPTN